MMRLGRDGPEGPRPCDEEHHGFTEAAETD
jgi:hypothetical protein